jgi:hypothetical protein
LTGLPEESASVPNSPDHEAVLAQFNRLMQELLRGRIERSTFRPWEVELLLDIESCDLPKTVKRNSLRGYQKVVQHQMDKGAARPSKFSEYLKSIKIKHSLRNS